MAKRKAIAISNVEIEVGDNKFNLSVDEARELLEILQEAFGPRDNARIIHEYIPYWRRITPYWDNPVWTVYTSSGGTADVSDTTTMYLSSKANTKGVYDG